MGFFQGPLFSMMGFNFLGNFKQNFKLTRLIIKTNFSLLFPSHINC